MKMDLKKMILITSTILLISIITFLKFDKLVLIDDFVYKFLSSSQNEAITNFMTLITTFGDYFNITAFIIIIIISVQNKEVGIIATINSIIGVIINRILKSIFVRPRPNAIRLVEETGYSFPSGHAMASMIFYGLLIYFVLKTSKSDKAKKIMISLLILFIILIGISRIYLGVHYFSDVIAGYLFGIIHLIIYISIVEKIRNF